MPLCCLCERRVDAWTPYAAPRSPLMAKLGTVGSDPQRYGCPHCGSNDRERHLWLYMTAVGLPKLMVGAHVLHLAPERNLERHIENALPARYVRGDLHPYAPGHLKLDAHALPFENGSFDLVIANHLLEHVRSPQQVLAEFVRCLKPGGMLIAQTPYAPSVVRTLETNVPLGDEWSTLLYGQADHVRLFGQDITEHFLSAGLQGGLFAHADVLKEIDAEEFGCNELEPFFAFSKPSTARHPATA